jgi:hypothetical protein
MLDRETRREKIVEARKRERRVKGKVRGGGEVDSRVSQLQIAPSTPGHIQSGILEDPQLAEAERHFFAAVQPVRLPSHLILEHQMRVKLLLLFIP